MMSMTKILSRFNNSLVLPVKAGIFLKEKVLILLVEKSCKDVEKIRHQMRGYLCLQTVPNSKHLRKPISLLLSLQRIALDNQLWRSVVYHRALVSQFYKQLKEETLHHSINNLFKNSRSKHIKS